MSGHEWNSFSLFLFFLAIMLMIIYLFFIFKTKTCEFDCCFVLNRIKRITIEKRVDTNCMDW